MPANHSEDEHAEVQQTEARLERRGAKKRRRMRVAGKSVFVLGRLLKKGPRTRQSARRRGRRR